MILDVLLEDVLKEPKNNIKTYLKKRLKELSGLNEEELKGLAAEAKEGKNKIIIKKDQETKEKYWVG
jgi:hypothetical protein